MADEPIDLSEARAARYWKEDWDPNAYGPADALRAALRRVESGDFAADHVVIVLGNRQDEGSTHSIMQGGSFSHLEASGLLAYGMRLHLNPE